MTTFDDLMCGDLIIFRREGEERRGVVTRANRPGANIAANTIDGELDVREADYVRKVELEGFKETKCNLFEMASAAADYMRAMMTESEALREVCYMLGGKLHKYMPEAWLGGAALERALAVKP